MTREHSLNLPRGRAISTPVTEYSRCRDNSSCARARRSGAADARSGAEATLPTCARSRSARSAHRRSPGTEVFNLCGECRLAARGMNVCSAVDLPDLGRQQLHFPGLTT